MWGSSLRRRSLRWVVSLKLEDHEIIVFSAGERQPFGWFALYGGQVVLNWLCVGWSAGKCVMGTMVFLYEEILCGNSKDQGWITEELVSLQNDKRKNDQNKRHQNCLK